MSVFINGKGHDKDLNWRSGRIRLRAQAADFVLINFFKSLEIAI